MQADALIVGGSLNGLTMALLLAHHGVRPLVVERNPGTTVQYKFSGASPRTMEIFRGLGIQREIQEHRTGDQKSAEVARARNLADPEPHFMGKPWADTQDLSAAEAETIDQDRLEPILRAHAEDLGANVQFNTEFVGFRQQDNEIVATIRDMGSGQAQEVRAAYLIAADGVAGKTREMLGIERSGPGFLQHWMNLIIETDLEPVIAGKRFTSAMVSDINASFTPREDRWMLATQYQPDKGESPEQFDQAKAEELVRRGAARNDVEVKLYDARAWEVAALIADRFCAQRTFIIGDAAHSIPPTGGFGGNTGIHDAHNLAWKLGFVLKGLARPELLDTYDQERRPVAEGTLRQALARLAAWFKDPSKKLPPAEAIVDDFNVIFGHRYPRGAVVPDADEDHELFENPREAIARAGSRAPHITIDRGGSPVPIHDLFGRGFVLLAGGQGEQWSMSAARLTALGVGVHCVRIGPGGDAVDASGQFEARYAVGARGAVLVRPDGFVASRFADDTDADAALRGVLDRLAIIIPPAKAT